jgi:hypothetical protein
MVDTRDRNRQVQVVLWAACEARRRRRSACGARALGDRVDAHSPHGNPRSTSTTSPSGTGPGRNSPHR